MNIVAKFSDLKDWTGDNRTQLLLSLRNESIKRHPESDLVLRYSNVAFDVYGAALVLRALQACCVAFTIIVF